MITIQQFPFCAGGIILIHSPIEGGFEFFPAPSLRGASYATWQSHL